MDMEDEKSEPITEVKFVEVNDPVKIFLKVKSDSSASSSKSESSSESSSATGIAAENVDLVYKAPPAKLFRSSFIDKTKELFSRNRDDVAFAPEMKSPLKANLIWIVVMIIGSLMAFTLVCSSWRRFQSDPMITKIVLNDKDKRITYPTVTICPKNSADPRQIAQFILNWGLYVNGSKELDEFFGAIPNFSYDADELKYVILTPVSRRKLKQLDYDGDLRSLAFEFARSCDQVFKSRSCTFRGKKYQCCDVFLPIYTERGFCYTFNSRIYGKSFDEKINYDIFYIYNNDYSWDLKFYLKKESEILVNSYEETPIAGYTPKFDVDPEKHPAVVADISLVETVSDPSLKRMLLKHRKCLFKDEKKFKYYKDEDYSYSTCIKECHIKRALDICGCLPPVYQNENMVNLTKCDFYSLKCLKDQRVIDDRKCNCLLPCAFTAVNVDNQKKMFVGKGFVDNRIRNSFDGSESDVTVSLKQFPVVHYRQEIKFGTVDYLVSFGSIFALFSSFSILSIIELLLYLAKNYLSKSHATKTEIETI